MIQKMADSVHLGLSLLRQRWVVQSLHHTRDASQRATGYLTIPEGVARIA
jgi:hypothetical protein